MIFQDQHILEIDNLQRESFGGGIVNYDEYLANAAVIFSRQMLKYFCNDILLHKLYYIDKFSKDAKLKDAKYTTIACSEDIYSLTTDSSLVMATINKLENKVKNRETNSFITLGHREKLKAIVCYQGFKNPEIPISGFLTFSLEGENIDFHSKLNIDSSKNYSLILDSYRDVSKNILGDTYFYVLKSRNLGEEFKGSLLLITCRSISIDEYLEIADFFTFIMSARIKYEYKKEILNRTFVDEFSHSLKHISGAFRTHLMQIKGRTLKYGDVLLDYHVNQGDIQTESFNKRNNFLLSLMRVGMNKENLQDLEKENIINTLSCHHVSIKSCLQMAAETLRHSTLELGLTRDSHRKLIQNNCIPLLTEKLKDLEDIKVNVISEGLKLVLEDLLKNAVFNTHYKNPEVDIFFKQYSESDSVELHISNNIEISDEYLNLINQDYNSEYVAKRYKAGIRIVRRIVTHPIFNISGTGWKIKCSKGNGWTNIYLIIPKSDIKNET